jgi:transcriptional regulator with XRE-family HTH domain
MLDFTFITAPELCRELAKRLKAQRMRLDLSQPELALRAGVALGTVSGFEKTGKGTLETFLRLVIALGLTFELEKLFTHLPTSIEELEASLAPVRQRVARKRKRLT